MFYYRVVAKNTILNGNEVHRHVIGLIYSAS